MTTLTPFAPSPIAPFQFSPTLDRQTCISIVTWNTFGQRWYLNIYNQSQTLIVCTPVVSSPPTIPIAGITWANGTATLTTQTPHGYKFGRMVNITVSGCTPNAYNGSVQAFVTGASTLAYPITLDPGPISLVGVVAYNISLVAGYFASTLVFREDTQTFEVSP